MRCGVRQDESCETVEGCETCGQEDVQAKEPWPWRYEVCEYKQLRNLMVANRWDSGLMMQHKLQKFPMHGYTLTSTKFVEASLFLVLFRYLDLYFLFFMYQHFAQVSALPCYSLFDMVRSQHEMHSIKEVKQESSTCSTSIFQLCIFPISDASLPQRKASSDVVGPEPWLHPTMARFLF